MKLVLGKITQMTIACIVAKQNWFMVLLWLIEIILIVEMCVEWV